MYTSASISRKPQGAPPTFATATWLNSPIFVEVFNVSDSGENIWSFASDNKQATFMVDQARHSEAFGLGAIDTLAGLSGFTTPSNCSLYAWSSLASTSTPAWSWSLENCGSSLL